MPLVIGAVDKVKAALLSLPASGKTLIGTMTHARLYTGVAQTYRSPASAYRYLLRMKRDRQAAVSTYADFRRMADLFDPGDQKALQQKQLGQAVTREQNVVSASDWNLALKPGTVLDLYLKAAFTDKLGGLTVDFIRHKDGIRLKRLELLVDGADQPTILTMLP
jgi:hypothetical protein